MEPVKDIHPTDSIKDLINQFKEAGGFTAKKLADGVEILTLMNQTNCFKFLSFPAAIMATGTRGIIVNLIKNKKFDAIITTCGTLDHDISRIKKPYYQGRFGMDDVELHKTGFHRLGNVIIESKSHGPIIEDLIKPLLSKLYSEGKKELSSKELVWEIGKEIETHANKEESFCYWAYKHKIPVFIPGITDGAVGSQLWAFYNKHKDFRINILEDEEDLANIAFEHKVTGALLLGGGISKHHTIWWNQFKGGLDYAVQISTAVEWDGSLSGAQTREAISWGKLKEQAKHVTIEGDVTVLLPLMISDL